MHTLDVILLERARASLLSLTSASIVRPRVRLTGQLDRLQAAGSALRWVRQATPLRTPEPDVWSLLQELLDDLDQERPRAAPSALLVIAGLRLLAYLGYGLDLDACVVCGRPCPPDRAAHVDPVRGGLVCRRCGGAGRMLRGATRQRVHLAIRGQAVLSEEDLPVLVELLESALLAHASVKLDGGAGPSPTRRGVR
jgi:DNA repair protein RecO (recombination protein O)